MVAIPTDDARSMYSFTRAWIRNDPSNALSSSQEGSLFCDPATRIPYTVLAPPELPPLPAQNDGFRMKMVPPKVGEGTTTPVEILLGIPMAEDAPAAPSTEDLLRHHSQYWGELRA